MSELDGIAVNETFKELVTGVETMRPEQEDVNNGGCWSTGK